MNKKVVNREFIPLNISVLTISDTRDEDTDISGICLVEMLQDSGHTLNEKIIVPDDIEQIRKVTLKWISNTIPNAIRLTPTSANPFAHPFIFTMISILDLP